ncbi:MAG: ABC transporter permease [Anaerolineales bacterium]|nr:ABC transporter permease [Anaerolineales bacterium]MCK5314999.1 ABC transporter permease [Anaerolineales bacterium]MCK5428842.1 ABC transporter permease [Anaerolineales bacterium]
MKKIFQSAAFRELLRVLIAIIVALTIGFIITVLVSDDPIGAYKAFLFGPLSKLNRFGDWIEESITLIFLGLAVALVFKAELFSLGQEGQMVLGALVAGAIALFVPVPGYIRIPLAILGAMLAGFLWGLIPGYLKAYLNANEIVSTLMLNVIALKTYEWLLTYNIKPEDAGYTASETFSAEGTMSTFFPPIPFLGELRTLFMNQTNISIAVYIVIIATIVVYYLMYHTPFGYELRMVGANIKFARYGGVNTKRTIVLAMAISGIFAGLAGAHLASGIHRKLILNITFGLGFEGIIVAILARNNPLLIPFTGLAYGYLRAGANVMERTSDMSREMVLVIQAIIILLVTAERIMPIIQERLRVRRAQKSGVPPAGASPTEGGD